MKKTSIAAIALTIWSASASAAISTPTQTATFTGLSTTAASDTTVDNTSGTSSVQKQLSFDAFNANTGVLVGVSSTLNVTSGTLSLSSSGTKTDSSKNTNTIFNSTASTSANSSLSGFTTFGNINELSNSCSGSGNNKCFSSTAPIASSSDTSWINNSATASTGNLNSYVGTSPLTSTLTVTNSVSLTGATNVTKPTATSSVTGLAGSQSLTYSYLNHANASFTSGTDTNSLTKDVSAGAYNFSIFNLGTATDTANLSLSSSSPVCISGNCGDFSLTQSFMTLAGGGHYDSGSISLADTAGAGFHSAVFSLVFKDSYAGAASSTLKENSLLFNVSGTVAVAAVPEPETYAMLLAGLTVIGLKVRRRKSQA